MQAARAKIALEKSGIELIVSLVEWFLSSKGGAVSTGGKDGKDGHAFRAHGSQGKALK